MAERFEFLEKLGSGGMGTVWKARDRETGELVAVKLMREIYAEDPSYVARFEREMDLVRLIDSPHVVRVLGFGRREGVPFIAMEFVDGPTLRELIKERGPMPWDEVMRVGRDIGLALAAAHASGIVHRDVKPSNILLAADGTAKLADFGIATASELTRLTGSSTMLGTPHYMAPDLESTPASDMYSLGCVLFELLTGGAPFEGTTQQQIIIRHIREQPDVSRIPPQALATIRGLLDKDPSRRPTADALSSQLVGAAVQSRHVGSTPRVAGKRPRLLWIAGLAISVIAVVVLFLSTFDGPSVESSHQAALPSVRIAGYTTLGYEVPESSEGVHILVGPVLYYADSIEISFRLRTVCNTSSGIDWVADIGSVDVRLELSNKTQVPVSGVTGIAGRTEELPCDQDFDGSWIFKVPSGLTAMTLRYPSPVMIVEIPPLGDAIEVNDNATVNNGGSILSSGSTCELVRQAPSYGSGVAGCLSDYNRAVVVGNSIENLILWHRVRTSDGEGWIESSRFSAATGGGQ